MPPIYVADGLEVTSPLIEVERSLNSRRQGCVKWRAIDLDEDDKVDEKALKSLIRAAAA
jgi:hypothetical protein